MIRFLVRKALDDKSFSENRRITLSELCSETGISKGTLNRILNEQGCNVGVHCINELCRYFNCQPGDLLTYVEDHKK
ncbi:helix-turn-helix domain-containing protein [Endozoicomonas atrinae]|uniref:helix-turn-helix domain-containing protein n=1 Tax=Endozoicomonas atrinae TaxID=1333660 RepID=UPI0009F59C97|nr:helix-turn-helix transcriptional regulator [Endozoicomonas atrinae]